LIGFSSVDSNAAVNRVIKKQKQIKKQIKMNAHNTTYKQRRGLQVFKQLVPQAVSTRGMLKHPETRRCS
jgi:hypothetical protein